MKTDRKIFKLILLNKNGYKVIKFIVNYIYQASTYLSIKNKNKMIEQTLISNHTNNS